MVKKIILIASFMTVTYSQAMDLCVATAKDRGKQFYNSYEVVCDGDNIFETKVSLFSPKKAKKNIYYEMNEELGAVEEIKFLNGYDRSLFIMNDAVGISSRSDLCFASFVDGYNFTGYIVECSGDELKHYKAEESLKGHREISPLDVLKGNADELKIKFLSEMTKKLIDKMTGLGFELVESFETTTSHYEPGPTHVFVGK